MKAIKKFVTNIGRHKNKILDILIASCVFIVLALSTVGVGLTDPTIIAYMAYIAVAVAIAFIVFGTLRSGLACVEWWNAGKDIRKIQPILKALIFINYCISGFFLVLGGLPVFAFILSLVPLLLIHLIVDFFVEQRASSFSESKPGTVVKTSAASTSSVSKEVEEVELTSLKADDGEKPSLG